MIREMGNVTDELRGLNTKRFDTMSISNYVIKKECGHGARQVKSEEQIFHHQSLKAWKLCRKKEDRSGENFKGILDHFLRDPQYREAQGRIGWTEAKCKELDEKST